MTSPSLLSCTFKVIAPKMDHSSNSTLIFEGKMNREDTQNEAHARKNVR